MTKASKLFAAFAWSVVSLALSSGASAASGRISFSGALVNPSCQLSLTLASSTKSEHRGTVNASECGNAPSTFSRTVNVGSRTTSIGQGVGQILVHETEAGPVLEVSYN
jgi:type 1 fimbria pilin